MIELKPCPFCGGEAEAYICSDIDPIPAHIECARCRIGTPRRPLKLAIEDWNRRVE